MQAPSKTRFLLLSLLLIVFSANSLQAQFSLRQDINTGPEGSSPYQFITYGDYIYFSANTTEYKYELYRLHKHPDSTAIRVSDLKQEGNTYYPAQMVISGDWLFVYVRDDDHGPELWSLDLLNNGMLTLVEDICPGTCWYNYNEIVPDGNGNVYFVQWNHADYGTELWTADHTGAHLVEEVNPGKTTSDIYNPIYFDGLVFFKANLPGKPNYQGLYSYTPGQGMNLLSSTEDDFNPTMYDGVQGPDVFYFSAQKDTFGMELWYYQKDHGMRMVKNINNTGPYHHSYPINLGKTQMIFQGELYFMADDGIHGDELWKTVTTATVPDIIKDAVMVKDIREDDGNTAIQMLGIYNNELYFRASDGYGNELWKTDGTAAGTMKVKDISPGLGEDTNPVMVGVMNGLMYFYANDQVHGFELWVTDGTEQNTTMVSDLWPGEMDGFERTLSYVVLDDVVYFRSGADTTVGYELWTFQPSPCDIYSFDLGGDQSMLTSESITLNGPAGMDSYSWSTGEATPDITLNGVDLGSGTHNIALTINKNGCTVNREIVLTVEEVTRAKEVQMYPEIKIHMDKNTGQITIKRTNNQHTAWITLYGINGTHINKLDFRARQSELTVDFTGFHKGIYIIRYSEADTGRSVIKKIVLN